MTSSSNPRKFAEKIAKLQQKEQEHTMAFEQIMAEVIVATRVSLGTALACVVHIGLALRAVILNH